MYMEITTHNAHNIFRTKFLQLFDRSIASIMFICHCISSITVKLLAL